jgi:hypothetical protein
MRSDTPAHLRRTFLALALVALATGNPGGNGATTGSAGTPLKKKR